MATVDPTYPLYPIACILASTMLLLVLLTSFIRQNWNLGVAFLCFWLFWENLTGAVNTIAWSDNGDIKYYVYCDIVSHLQIINAVVKPMATLIITRQLYFITNRQPVGVSAGKATQRKNLAIEWTLGFVFPALVAGPLYYIVQTNRFQINEGFGCSSTPEESVLGILSVAGWNVILPLLSIFLYYPRAALTFYRQNRDTNSFLRSSDSDNPHNQYIRILALASIDILITLPIGIVNIVLVATSSFTPSPLPFYSGFARLHKNWAPESLPYADLKNLGRSTLAQVYFSQWTSPVLAFAIFGLFRVTKGARASYARVIYACAGRFGWKPAVSARGECTTLGTIAFGESPLDSELESQLPTFVDIAVRASEQDSNSVEVRTKALQVRTRDTDDTENLESRRL